MSHFFYTCVVGALLAVISLPQPAGAAPYFKPDEAKEIFQIEKIPLQVDSMKEVARHLTNLSQRQKDNSSANQRSTAQLLALAMRLDPANQDAREINQQLAKGEQLNAPDQGAIKTAKARLRFYVRWLATPEAGTEANKLAQYLTDATKTLNKETHDNPDTANWAEVVPTLDKYGKVNNGTDTLPKPPKNDDIEDPDGMDEGDTPEPPPSPNPSDGVAKDFQIKELKIAAPFAVEIYSKTRDPRNPARLISQTNKFDRVSEVKLSVRACKPEEKNRLSISSIASNKDSIKNDISSLLYQLLASRHSNLTAYKSAVTISGGSYSRKNGLSLAAPLALMLEASLANTPLRDDVHICADIDAEGKLSPPTNFWQLLTALRKSKNGGRLIVSDASAKLMIQVLVYDEADFFARWEVFTASNIDEALAVGTKRNTASITEAGQLFDSVQNLARKTDVTKLAVNRAVRTRLAKVAQLAPRHISAKILLLQGSGKRPMRLSEEALAHELLPVVKKMNQDIMVEFDKRRLKESSLKAIHESARENLDKLERLVDRSNDDIYQEAIRLANDFRRLMTITRRMNSNDSGNSDEKKARGLFFDMQRSSRDLLSRTMIAAGFPTAEPAIEAK